jgi:hypothetical protein
VGEGARSLDLLVIISLSEVVAGHVEGPPTAGDPPHDIMGV